MKNKVNRAPVAKKNKIHFIAMLFIACLFSSQLNAQLKVESSGDVIVSKTMSFGTTLDTCSVVNVYKQSMSTQTYYGVNSHVCTRTATLSGSVYGVYSFADGLLATESSSTLRRIVGVYGKALSSSSASNKFTAGIAGVATSYRGIGVYGDIATASDYTLPASWGAASYAGYFNGNTKVVGTLTCTSLTQTSDARTKHDITYLRDNALGSIMQLKPISFYYNTDNKLFNTSDVESPAAQQMHYGFIAQELQEVLPNIVYIGQDSLLSVNYIELIPLLVQVVQAQQQQIADLQNQVQLLTIK